jgi:hypothetical protein
MAMIADMIKERVQNRDGLDIIIGRFRTRGKEMKEWNQHEFSNRFSGRGIMISSQRSPHDGDIFL